MKLNNEIAAIVTGGASGLGEATARALAGKGVRVALFDMKKDAGVAVAKDIEGMFIEVDVSNPESVAAGVAAAAEEIGTPRICVNCAGVAPAQKTVSKGVIHDAALFQKVININLVGTFNVASHTAQLMAAADPLTVDGERGVIVNTASVAAFDGQIGQVAYGTSKAGVAGMTLPMARDLSRDGIRVMTIAPGIFGTPMLMAMPEEVQDALGKQVPFPSRLGKPEEYANLVMAIAENEMMNGETIRLDGAIRMAPR